MEFDELGVISTVSFGQSLHIAETSLREVVLTAISGSPALDLLDSGATVNFDSAEGSLSVSKPSTDDPIVLTSLEGSFTLTADGQDFSIAPDQQIVLSDIDNDGVLDLFDNVIPNVAPIAQDDTVGPINSAAKIIIDVLANDSDSDGSLNLDSVTIDTAPLNGTVVVGSVTGQITYTHDGSSTTSDSFTYTVADNEGAVSNVATVTINLETNSCVFATNNRVLNGSFEENLTDWVYHNNGSGTAAVTMVDPYHCDFAAKLDFTNPGNNVQLYQQNVTLDAATSYRFTFAARATTPRNITVYLHKHTAPYSNYGINAFTANLTTEWQTFTYDFQSSGFSGSVSDARLRFWLTTAQSGDTFFIDDVVIQKEDNDPENQLPIANIISDFTSGIAPLTVNFDASGSMDPDDNITSYNWGFGDGTSDTGVNPNHIFDAEGTYDVELTVTDDEGGSDTTTLQISVNNPDEQSPTAAFSATPLSGLAPLTVGFDALASTDPDGNIISFNWNFGDGASDMGVNPSHTFDTEGTYDVILTVTDNNGKTDTESTSVTVNPETSSCVFATNNRVLNDSFEENLTDWVYHNNGSGTATVTMVDPYHCDFAAKLDFTNPGNNVQLYQQNVTLDAATSYRFTFAARATTPRNITVYLHKHTAPYSNYGINAFTANLTTEWQTFTYDFFQSSGFSGSVSDARLRFWLTTAQSGDTFFIDDVVIQKEDNDPENQLPIANIISDFTSGIAPLTVNFDASGSMDPDDNITSYNWDFGDGTSDTGVNPNHIFDAEGTYDVELTVTDDEGGSDTTTLQISVNNPDEQSPTAAFSATPLSGLAPLTVGFDALASTDPDGNIISFNWNFGDGASDMGVNPSHTFDTEGTYDVILTVTDNNGKTDTESTSVTVNPETSSCVFATNNRVLNDSFEENLTDWVYHNNGSGTATVTMVDPYHCDFAAKLDFTNPGNNVQLYQQNVTLDAATSYRFTFAARATTPRNITVYLHKHTAPYSNYGINAFTANLTTEWQTFTYDFQSKGFAGSVSDGRLRFWLTTAQPGDTFFIDDVVIQKKGIEPPEPMAPTIQTQPQDTSASIGQSAVFTVTAQGTVPLQYQWQRNGEDITGANSASYIVENLTALSNIK